MSLMKDMLAAGVHYGHKKRFWNPKMKPYIFTINHGIHILDLDQSAPMFQDALNMIGKVAARKGKIMFVGTKKQAQLVVSEEAQRCNMPFVNFRWLGGMLTNYKTIRQSVRKLKDLEKSVESGKVAMLTKTEQLAINKKIEKLENTLGGIKDFSGLPDVIVVIDTTRERIAIQEANCLGIPVVAVVDSNASPEGVDYVIPGNDDAVKSIRFYLSTIADTINDAKIGDAIVQAAESEEETEENQ